MPIYTGTKILSPLSSGTFSFDEAVKDAKLEISVEAKTHLSTERDIYDQAETIRKAVEARIDANTKQVHINELDVCIGDVMRCHRMVIVGAGSSYHCALGVRQIMEELTEAPVFVEYASDFVDRDVPIFRDDVCIVLSQSGETSSALAAARYCKSRDALVVAVTNNSRSSLAALACCSIDILAGPEVGATSTKTYIHEMLTMIMVALQLAADKKPKLNRTQHIISEMLRLSPSISRVLKQSQEVENIAKEIYKSSALLVMGRGYHQASCLEGSFKFKEMTNIHGQGLHSGELKHGPLALIDEKIPIVMIVTRDAIYDKNMNAVQQVKARGGQPIIICEEGDDQTASWGKSAIFVPRTADCLSPILAVVPLQMLALAVARFQHKDTDNPKCLKKVVLETVYDSQVAF